MRPKTIFELVREAEEAVLDLKTSVKEGHSEVEAATKNLRRILSTILRRTRKWAIRRRANQKVFLRWKA